MFTYLFNPENLSSFTLGVPEVNTVHTSKYGKYVFGFVYSFNDEYNINSPDDLGLGRVIALKNVGSETKECCFAYIYH